jgi:16S rRNA (cytidine1402-2'-O)-methyltransferase
MPNLYLIPTSLNPEIAASVLIEEQKEQIHHLKHFIVETAKIGRAHLKQLGLALPLQQLEVLELNKHKQDYSALIEPLKQGFDVGLISDCGCPAVADPGSRVVSIAHAMGFTVVPLIGPSSILLTLMASGLNGQKFSFLGYLPAEPTTRKTRLKQLEGQILKEGITQIFIEAPFRNQHLFDAMISSLNHEIKLCVGINLMTAEQQIISKTIGQWQRKPLRLDKQEVIFLLGQ